VLQARKVYATDSKLLGTTHWLLIY